MLGIFGNNYLGALKHNPEGNMEIHIVKREELDKYAEGFCKLYKTSFKGDMDEKTFMQRYYDNPYKDVCMCLAIDDGKVIANYAVSPRRAMIDNQVVKCAQSINTVTHPQYQKKGIFIHIANILYDDLRSRGYKFIYGFANHISNRIFNSKLNWKTIYEVPTMTFDLEEREIDSVLKINKIFREDKPNSDVYCSSDKDNKKYIICKTLPYIKWRYANSSEKKYVYIYTEKGSWCVFKKYQDIVNVVELHNKDIEDYEQLILWLIEYIKKEGLKRVTLWEPINTEEHIILEKIGFRNRYPIYTFSAMKLDPSFSSDIFDYRSWKLQLGDENEY